MVCAEGNEKSLGTDTRSCKKSGSIQQGRSLATRIFSRRFPTSSDIYLEVDGKKVAVVQSYTAQSTKSSTTVEAFGEREPVATIPGQSRHVLELTRIYATDEALADGIHFHDLEDFSLVICKPDRKVIYSGCEWSDIQEEGQLNAMVAEKITVVASKRLEATA